MRRFLAVIEDPESALDGPEPLEAILKAGLENDVFRLKVARVQRGGLLADKVMNELPPVRHKDQGVYR